MSCDCWFSLSSVGMQRLIVVLSDTHLNLTMCIRFEKKETLFAPYLFNGWMNLANISLRDIKELIRFAIFFIISIGQNFAK